MIITTDREHIFFDNVDSAVLQKFDVNIDAIIYASKHKSTSGMRSLTIHPVGNVGSAQFGGLTNKVVQAAPHLMTSALRILKKTASQYNLNFSVSFEATHHGPFLTAPTFFIEIGSDEVAWNIEDAGKVCASTILELEKFDVSDDTPVAIGIGGGHYMPRITDVALERKVAFGHLIATYAVPKLSENIFNQIIEKTPRAKYVYFHRKALAKADISNLEKRFRNAGMEVVREGDLEKLHSSD
jgi:D-aminoacyl-tRNA deacylase